MEHTTEKTRIHFIDEVRGFAILCMVVYHTFYDLVNIFNMRIEVFYSPIVEALVTVFVGIFVFISGTSCVFSKNNLKRGAKCLGLGLVFTLFTYFFMNDQLIVFGILHMLGVSMMIYALILPLLKKFNPITIIIVCTILFIITYNVEYGHIGIGQLIKIQLPHAIYDIGILFPFGFVSPNFMSADYFALFPWLFCFIAGSGFGTLVKQNKMPKFIYKSHFKPLAFVGRHTLIIYLLHQPIVYSVLYLLFKFIG